MAQLPRVVRHLRVRWRRYTVWGAQLGIYLGLLAYQASDELGPYLEYCNRRYASTISQLLRFSEVLIMIVEVHASIDKYHRLILMYETRTSRCSFYVEPAINRSKYPITIPSKEHPWSPVRPGNRLSKKPPSENLGFHTSPCTLATSATRPGC